MSSEQDVFCTFIILFLMFEECLVFSQNKKEALECISWAASIALREHWSIKNKNSLQTIAETYADGHLEGEQ